MYSETEKNRKLPSRQKLKTVQSLCQAFLYWAPAVYDKSVCWVSELEKKKQSQESGDSNDNWHVKIR